MFNNDIPIKNPSDDLLDRQDFSRQLANAISEYDNKECLTIGLYGSWGSGKTSILNLFENNIYEISQIKNKKYTIIKYDPWIISNQDQLINQFFKQLSLALQKDINNKKLKNIANILITYSDALSYTSLIPVIGKFGAWATFIGKKTGETINKIVEARNTNIQDKKDIITKELSDLEEKFIFIIDDIDRLTKIEIQEIFKLIKAIANFPNIIYILAFDRDIVVEALNQVQTSRGEEFLEKIVQIPFKIPEPQKYTLKKYFFEKFYIICEDFDKMDDTYINSLYENSISLYAKSIRDINRLLNSYYLNYCCLKTITHCVDLLGITAIQVFEPEVYLNLYSFKNNICCDSNIYIARKEQEEVKKILSILLDKKIVKNEKATKNLLAILFPYLYELGNEFIVSNYYNRDALLIKNHISHIKNFSNYFTFSLDKDRILETEVKNILFKINAIEIENSLININKEEKIDDFLDSLYSHFNEFDETIEDIDMRIEILLLSICKLYLQFYELNKTSYVSIIKCTYILLKKINDIEKRYELFNNLVSYKDISIEIIYHLIKDIETAYRKYQGNAISWEWQDIIPADKLKIIEQLTFLRFSKEMLSGSLFKNLKEDRTKLNYKYISNWIIYLWEEIDRDNLSIAIQSLSKQNINFIYTISSFVSIDQNSVDEKNNNWIIKTDSLFNYFNLEKDYLEIMQYFEENQIFSSLDEYTQHRIAAIIVFMRKKEMFSDGNIPESEIDEVILELKNFPLAKTE